MEMAKRRVSELEDRAIENTQSENRDKRSQSWLSSCVVRVHLRDDVSGSDDVDSPPSHFSGVSFPCACMCVCVFSFLLQLSLLAVENGSSWELKSSEVSELPWATTLNQFSLPKGLAHSRFNFKAVLQIHQTSASALGQVPLLSPCHILSFKHCLCS